MSNFGIFLRSGTCSSRPTLFARGVPGTFWLICCWAGLAAGGAAPAGQGPTTTAPSQLAATPDPVKAEARLISNTRQLTFEGRRAGEGYYSRDDSMMVFQSERQEGNPFFQIYLLDLETGDIQRISNGVGKTTCAWIHPSNRKVLYASTHQDPQALEKQKQELEDRASGKQKRYSWDYDEHFELYEKNLGTGQYNRLTDAAGYDAEGSWSPDGNLIAFASNRHAYAQPLSPEDAKLFEQDKSFLMDIYIMNADGSGVRRLTQARGYDGGPFFSPDGKRICWRRFSEDGATAEIYTINIDGSDQRQLTRLGTMSWAPYYHPSGEYLIFTTNKHGFANFELYLVDAAGQTEPVRVTYTEGFDGLPTFTNDGKTISWTSNRSTGKQGQIFVAKWNHEAARGLLGGSSKPTGPAVSPLLADALPHATSPRITAEDARQYVEFLASEATAGRLTGSPGERLATEYVAEAFRRIGLKPAGTDGSYYQEFDFTAGVSLGSKNQMVLHDHPSQGTKSYTADRDWRPLAFSESGQFEPAEIAFAGYGIVAPSSEEFENYDSFVHLDVADKWVMAFRYMPEEVRPEHRQHLNRFSNIRYKTMVVRDKGARGLIIVSGPNSKVKNQLMPMRFDAALAGTSLPVISITDALAADLLQSADKNLKALQDKLDGGEPQIGFTIPQIRLGLSIDIHKVPSTGRNVIARLPAESGSDAPALLLGAHIDHLGVGSRSDSLARDDEKDAIHYGADDNASGVAGLLEIAEYLVHQRRDRGLQLSRDVIFAAWSGEELGLLGSNHYVAELGKQLGDSDDIHAAICAYLNMDMIGRLDKKLIVQGLGSSSVWEGEVERRNVPIGLPITTQDDSTLPTDATAFYLKGVPVLSVFTGPHADYHTPRDTPDKLNYEGLAEVARFVGLIARSLATGGDVPDYVVMAKPGKEAARASLRAYLGTIPDYGATDVTGLRLTGVTAGAPADQAGLKSGDVVVELAGRKIENIYDYTYAIEALKIGQPSGIVVLRDGKRLTMTITPGSRD